MTKKKILFVINQFFKGGAETALLNLFCNLDPQKYDVDFLIYDQLKIRDAISLIPLIPKWIHVCDAAEREGKIAYAQKVYSKIVRELTGRQPYRQECYSFIEGKNYDTAISYGEWFSPEFVATAVKADQKLVWIHSDLDKAQFFNSEMMFRYDRMMDGYLFVSEKSMEGALERFAHLAGRTYLVHNMCDDQGIRRAAEEAVEIPDTWKRPLLVTVANFREEKNHLRQVEAMHLLRQKGLQFTWVNMGSDTDAVLIGKIDALVKRYGLEDSFIRLPAQKSPYRYMKAADAVAVLSNFESWSLVITEAKLVGIPVIATRTSGALEQIEDGKTGVLCDFSAQDIADKIEKTLFDGALLERISQNLQGFSTKENVLEEFDRVIEMSCAPARTRLLYISDNINYVSGVQKVTATQAQALKEEMDVSIFSMEPANENSRRLFEGIRIYDMQECCHIDCLSLSARKVLLGRGYTLWQKCIRLFYALACRVRKRDWAIGLLTGKALLDFFEKFDTVCVLSEASQLRGRIAMLSKPKKVQWIHTDYALWSQFSSWTRQMTRDDGTLYQAYDTIVCLTNTSREGFVRIHPHLKERTIVISNMQPVEKIKQKAKLESDTVVLDSSAFNIVSIGRMDTEKAVDRILIICERLMAEGHAFHWYLAGDGPKLEEWKALCEKKELDKNVHFLGAVENPYPLLQQATLFALLSNYEGLPVTIEEAKILHVPVIATNVGGIREQLENGELGMLVENEEEAIHTALKSLLREPEQLEIYQKRLETYEFDNTLILNQLKVVFERVKR